MSTMTEVLISLLTLTALEIVLGIDNLVFISIIAEKLPVEQRAKARNIGLILALVARLVLLALVSWVMGLTENLFFILGNGISGKDIILLVGGLFLLAKSTHEIHTQLEEPELKDKSGVSVTSFGSAIAQIVMLDIVFSLDSVITGVGLVDSLAVIAIAIILAIIVMLLTAKSISGFVNRHPTVKMLALSFLMLIGVMLVADAFEQHIPRGYIYFSMCFALLVELLNMKARARRQKN